MKAQSGFIKFIIRFGYLAYLSRIHGGGGRPVGAGRDGRREKWGSIRAVGDELADVAGLGRWLVGAVGVVAFGISFSQLQVGYRAKFREKLALRDMHAWEKIGGKNG